MTVLVGFLSITLLLLLAAFCREVLLRRARDAVLQRVFQIQRTTAYEPQLEPAPCFDRPADGGQRDDTREPGP